MGANINRESHREPESSTVLESRNVPYVVSRDVVTRKVQLKRLLGPYASTEMQVETNSEKGQ